MTAVISRPNFTSVPFRVRMKASEKSGLPMTAAIRGLMMPSTRASTMFLKAAPMMTPTASSTTLPREMNSLKPLSMASPVLNEAGRAGKSESPKCLGVAALCRRGARAASALVYR